MQPLDGSADDNRPPRCLLFVLNYNGTKLTCDLLNSLRCIGFPHPVWIVDNGSDRDDSAAFSDALPGVTVKKIAENCGFAGGVNRAVRMAADEGYDFVYELNNDTLAVDDFLAPCAEIMARRPDVDIVASRTKNKDPETGEFSRWGYHSNPDEARNFQDGFLETRHVSGCGMLLRVSTFLAFGGLDERFFCYGEENDYCYRLAKAGRKQGFAETSLILHQGKMTTGGTWPRYFGARNTILFSLKHDSSWQDSGMILAKQVIIPAYADFLAGRFERTAPVGHGFADAIAGRYGKRVIPFRKVRGTFFFLALAPFILLYCIFICARMHPFRPRPIP